jgi:AmmeMemoRadiSam system protein B
MTRIRPTAVAGQFYPGRAAELRQTVLDMLAQHADQHSPSVPKAIVAPHAGFIYSGIVAAAAYARVREWSDSIHRVVLLGPAHRVWLSGLGLSTADEFATPLGSVELDATAAERVAYLPQVSYNDDAHASEHSLEVQLPFLQLVLTDFKLLPIVVGEAAPEEVQQVLACFWEDPTTLFVVSTDLSHYHDYDSACDIDERTSQAIIDCRDAQIGPDNACGCRPLNGLLRMVHNSDSRVEPLMICNSGDTAGARDRVVGYGAYVVH